MHYDPLLIDSLTGWNSFNLSMAGAGTEGAFRLLKLYLRKSSVPERIFYEVDLNFLHLEDEDLYRFNNFFPYLRDKGIRESFAYLEPRMPWFHYLAYYSWPYTGWSNLSSGFRAWMRWPIPDGENYRKGYLPGPIRGGLTYAPVQQEKSSLSLHHGRYLDSLQMLCKSRGITLHLLSSPIFAGGRLSLSGKEQLEKTLKEHAAKYNNRYSNLSSLPFCNQRELFLDLYHMNASGARLYSRYFVDYFYTKIKP